MNVNPFRDSKVLEITAQHEEVHLELAQLRQWHESVVEQWEILLKEKEVQVTTQRNELLQEKEFDEVHLESALLS